MQAKLSSCFYDFKSGPGINSGHVVCRAYSFTTLSSHPIPLLKTVSLAQPWSSREATHWQSSCPSLPVAGMRGVSPRLILAKMVIARLHILINHQSVCVEQPAALP